MTAVAVFAGTLLLILLRPLGLSIGTGALLGALAAWLVGAVSPADLLHIVQIVWDPTLAFVGIVLTAMALEEMGFFDWAAVYSARLSRGNGHRLYVNMILLGALSAALFANDGAALILTPVILAKMRYLKLPAPALFAFVMAGGFIGDTASNALVVSNLTNILTADFFHLDFLSYAQTMFWPNLLAVTLSLAVLWLLFHNDLPTAVNLHALPDPSTLINPRLLKQLWPLLIFLGVTYIAGDLSGLPVSAITLSGAGLLLWLGHRHKALEPLKLLRRAPWQIIWFSVGLYVVVWGLHNAGLSRQLAHWLLIAQSHGETAAVLGTGFLAAILSALLNNLPAVMMMNLALDHLGPHLHTAMIYANVIGCNIGPKLTPFGSLATLLWLHLLKEKGVVIGWREYLLFGLSATPPVLAASLAGLLF
ncbi:MAG: arsenical efflux pump membrane protein ArsB [Epsilonproteobacteria bacterium]|nr:arsenical efflux pump membrane protein ArsB [Campylobacterota bacterium]